MVTGLPYLLIYLASSLKSEENLHLHLYQAPQALCPKKQQKIHNNEKLNKIQYANFIQESSKQNNFGVSSVTNKNCSQSRCNEFWEQCSFDDDGLWVGGGGMQNSDDESWCKTIGSSIRTNLQSRTTTSLSLSHSTKDASCIGGQQICNLRSDQYLQHSIPFHFSGVKKK